MVGVFRDQLPHWVAECGCYAVTLRCRRSLPKHILERLREEAAQKSEIIAGDDATRDEQRRFFLSLEHYLDQGHGLTPFRDESLAWNFSRWLSKYDDDGLHFSEWVVMPNHLHLITRPLQAESCEQFRQIWIRFKMRSTRFLTKALRRDGAFWQRSWFGRWIRDAAELERWQHYLEQNPVKANLCTRTEEWPGGSSYQP